jgi:hypothetical protein
MTLQLPTSDIKAALAATLSSAISAEKQFGMDAAAQVQALIEELYPLLIAQTQALLAAKDPAVPRAYLAVLQGCVDATVAKLGLTAIDQQRQIMAGALQTAVQVLALVLKAAVLA